MSKLPIEWKKTKLGNFATIVTGNTPPTKEKDNFGDKYPWVTPTDIQSSKNIFTTERKLSDKGYLISRQLPKDTVLITSIASIGKNAILRENGSCNQQINAILPSENHDPDYIYYWFEKNTTFIKSLAGQTAVPILNKKDFSNIFIPLPPLQEQKKIAEILSTVDQKIAFVDNQIEETELLKKGLMQKLLTEGIGHTEFKDSEIGRIPKSWEAIKLNKMIENKSIISHLDGNHGGLYPKQSEFVDSGVPYIGANMIYNSKIDFSTSKYLTEERASLFKKGVAQNNDILFAHNATVGPVALLKTDLEYVILSTTLTYYRCDLSRLSNLYILYYMQSPKFVNQYERLMKQSTRNQIPITQQRTLYFILPPLEEQIQIAEILSTTDEKLETLKTKKESFEELKKGLMQKLLTGEVRV